MSLKYNKLPLNIVRMCANQNKELLVAFIFNSILIVDKLEISDIN